MSNIVFTAIKADKFINSPLWPNSEHTCEFMPAQVICKFDKDPINNECVSVETSFSHKSMRNCSSDQGRVTLK